MSFVDAEAGHRASRGAVAYGGYARDWRSRSTLRAPEPRGVARLPLRGWRATRAMPLRPAGRWAGAG
jgi:hypothetical protein